MVPLSYHIEAAVWKHCGFSCLVHRGGLSLACDPRRRRRLEAKGRHAAAYEISTMPCVTTRPRTERRPMDGKGDGGTAAQRARLRPARQPPPQKSDPPPDQRPVASLCSDHRTPRYARDPVKQSRCFTRLVSRERRGHNPGLHRPCQLSR